MHFKGELNEGVSKLSSNLSSPPSGRRSTPQGGGGRHKRLFLYSFKTL